MAFRIAEEINKVVRIKVVGVGGAGKNAINRMVEEGVQGVEFIAVNTDLQDLYMTSANHKIQIGEKVSKGLVEVKSGKITNRFYLFGGRDESSASLIQGLTLGGVLLDDITEEGFQLSTILEDVYLGDLLEYNPVFD